REKKEKEEREQREREEKERMEREERERKEKEEMELREREEKEREERIRKEQEEKERQEREEKERREREEKERVEKERKEREEKERREREEKERKEREEKERKEREEKERREREEKERKEREEKERKEREEKERKEREEKERKEREERERKEQEERERKVREEKERKEREEIEKKKKEEKEREEKEREEKERREQERIKREKEDREKRECEEQERIEKELKEQDEIEKKKEDEKVNAENEESEKKTEAELADKKDPKKDEKKFGKGHRPGPLDLSRTTSAPAGPLSSARIIDDLNSVQYPPNIKSPNPNLNANAVPGKYKYDRTFLMQFMNVCKEKPENLPALDAIGMDEPKDDKKGARNNPSRLGSRPPSQHAKSSPSQTSQFQQQMGEFKSTPKNNEDRFMMQSSSTSVRAGLGSNSFGRTLSRTGSGSALLPAPSMGVGASPPSPGRGSRRENGKRNSRAGPLTHAGGQDAVTPLEPTEGRWVPGMINPMHKGSDDVIPVDVIQRKVKALLNKLTLEKFDSISDQIINFANKSIYERDGRMLKEVIRLTFEKSCDEPNFSQMYAQLCRKMMERVDVEIVDENVTNSDGKFVQGGTLFRKYLLNRCQEDFEKGWKVNVPVPSNEKGEPDLMSDEYYTAAKAKRHGLGLIRFIGELFKLNMLTERIMHECVKKLLTVHGTPEEEEMESLCKLMTTVGQQLDHAKAKTHMDTYFGRMEEMSKNMKLSSRIRFMIMDVIDLRNNNWVPRRDNNAPKTIAEIHEDAAKQKEEAEILRRAASSGGRGMPKMADQISRGGSGRRDKNMSHGSGGQSVSSDGWSMVGGTSSTSRQTGDLSKFGSVSRSKVASGHVSLAPGGSAFASLGGGAKGWKTESKERKDKTESMSRTNSTSNTYGILAHSESTETRKVDSSSSNESAKAFTSTPERKKIILAPRSASLPLSSENPSAPKTIMTKPSISMSEEVAERKIISTVEEYFNIGDINEVILCIKELPKDFYSKAIETFSNKALEKKQDDVDKVIRLFNKFIIDNIVDKPVFIRGFTATVEFLIDIGADAPKSYTFTGQLFNGANLDLKDVSDLLKPLSDIDDKGLEKVLAGYLTLLKADTSEQIIARKVKESGFDFKSIFPKKSVNDINKFLEDLGLGSLKK
ncbi:3414_t:CDS:2, partial [Cetraspora pellucida]